MNPDKSEDDPSNSLPWINYYVKPRYFGFKGSPENDTSSLSANLEIVHTPGRCLPTPEVGYCYSCGFSGNSGLNEFVFDGVLIPFLVKRKFKRLLEEASQRLGLKDDMKLLRIIHGPALTIQAEVQTSDGRTHAVSIDLAVIIRGRVPFLPEMGWPRAVSSIKAWPPQDKIDSIRKKGINQVARKPFDWQLSFAELEKELVREIDADGGCRKQVHRIMKSVYYTVCTKAVTLSPYMLKNVWFLECEKYPDGESWRPDHLAERYYGCLKSLRECAEHRLLRQYFDRRINLLNGKDVRQDVENIIGFDFEKAVSKKRKHFVWYNWGYKGLILSITVAFAAIVFLKRM